MRNGALKPSNVDLWIVNYRRHEAVRETVAQWLDSFPFERVFVIDNHGGLEPAVFRERDRGKVLIRRSARPPWMMGSLAECWNLAYANTLPERDWVVCSQDDVTVNPGWAEVVSRSGFGCFFAPKGDMIHVNSAEVFGEVGWWDERFRTIHYQEADYMLRAMRACPRRVSISDDHPWGLRHNEVGLGQLFRESERTREVMETGDEVSRLYGEHLTETWLSKWGFLPKDIFAPGRYDLEPRWHPADIDWYPAVTHRMRLDGRL